MDCSRSGSFRTVLGERLRLFFAMFAVWPIIGVSVTPAIADAETFRGSSPDGHRRPTKLRSDGRSGTIPSGAPHAFPGRARARCRDRRKAQQARCGRTSRRIEAAAAGDVPLEPDHSRHAVSAPPEASRPLFFTAAFRESLLPGQPLARIARLEAAAEVVT